MIVPVWQKLLLSLVSTVMNSWRKSKIVLLGPVSLAYGSKFSLWFDPNSMNFGYSIWNFRIIILNQILSDWMDVSNCVFHSECCDTIYITVPGGDYKGYYSFGEKINPHHSFLIQYCARIRDARTRNNSIFSKKKYCVRIRGKFLQKVISNQTICFELFFFRSY